MSFIIFFVLSAFIFTEGTSTCIIENVDTEWSFTHNLDKAINDTYRGVLAVYRTENVQRIKIKKNDYFNVTWDSHTLTFATGDNFDKYEAESECTDVPSISVQLHFECTKDNTLERVFMQQINDTNNHSPQLNQTKFDYALGPTIPKGFVLTDLQPIKAVDMDITNRQLTFSIPENPYFKIDRETYALRCKEYPTKLVALQDITAPFYEELELTVTDSGVPPLQAKALITIRVLKPESIGAENTAEARHPPIFEKNFYLAYYTGLYEIEMEEAITIGYGLTNSTTVNLSNYNDYFSARFENATVTLNVLQKLPQELLASGFIILELEAVNEGLGGAGRTAVLIEFSDSALPTVCEVYVFGYTVEYPTVLLVSAIITIVLINVCVLYAFLNKQKGNASKC